MPVAGRPVVQVPSGAEVACEHEVVVSASSRTHLVSPGQPWAHCHGSVAGRRHHNGHGCIIYWPASLVRAAATSVSDRLSRPACCSTPRSGMLSAWCACNPIQSCLFVTAVVGDQRRGVEETVPQGRRRDNFVIQESRLARCEAARPRPRSTTTTSPSSADPTSP